MREEYEKWLSEKMAERCINSLKKNGFDPYFVPDSRSAREMIIDMVSNYNSFGIGGSDTVRDIGLVEELKKMGKVIHDHWQKGLTKEQDLNIRLEQGRAECFICSANAISLTGEIVNVDGIGNRVSAMVFGPKKVVIVAGVNKLRPDLPSAIQRVKEVAAPMRAKSLNMKTPCAETGICTDCNSPQRICRITTILHRKPLLTDISVVLINEVLGF
ncbi:MAG TPA: lactate utilization protein [Desulfobacteraceae bacterium]|nr:lactate utilization protein [Desulfobacteraceae bacterium]